MKVLADDLRNNSPSVRACDELGIHCIDYVTELMTDPGAFNKLQDVDVELKEISLDDVVADPTILMKKSLGSYLQ